MGQQPNPWPQLRYLTSHTTEEDVQGLVDLPTTVLLIKFVEEGDSAMGTVMLLNFLNAWKVQELTSRPGEPSDHTLQDSLLILGHTQPHPSGRRLTAISECRAADGGPGGHHPAPLTTAAKTSAMSCLPSPLLSCRPPHRTLTSSWQRLGMHKATHCSSSVVFPSDLPTTVLLIKLVEEGDSAMGTVMLLNFLNAWKVQEQAATWMKPFLGKICFGAQHHRGADQPPRRAQRPHPARQPAHPGTHTASPFRQETDGQQ
ncbi:uncharacterized protein LOC126996161 isoform X3 [Eriocheir sinensis]|uniref:uncharacterized protein LOC126996161 isoform X3 n=1 Tax=Eriocheir sinensis TaxID=95602 RepID=UPI0021C57387|nr:uncharacterized protein LOC126996161 isoform X3 [Eriocheir sinensis]